MNGSLLIYQRILYGLFSHVYLSRIQQLVICSTQIEEPVYTLSLSAFALIIGGIIAFTLAYVAWRKYRAERLQKKKKNGEQSH